MRPHKNTTMTLTLALTLGTLLLLGASTLAPMVTPEPTDESGVMSPVLVWRREGGIAGFCDDLTVFPDGGYTAAACDGETMQGTLTPNQRALIEAWIERLQPFEVDETDPAVVDAMTVRLTFAGKGPTTATEADRQAIQAFASEVYVGALTGEPSTTPAPDVLNPVRDEDRAYDAAREALVQLTGVALTDIRRVEMLSGDWPDACLGLAEPRELCAAMVTPGYRIVMEVNSSQYIARASADGSVVRFESRSDIVSWEEAVAIILDGQAVQVSQTHDLRVTLDLKDGSTVTTVEPTIDEVFDVVSRCGEICDDMILATE